MRFGAAQSRGLVARALRHTGVRLPPSVASECECERGGSLREAARRQRPGAMAAVLGVNAWVWIGFLFILYFTWEHAPWHASRATERAYMGFMTCSSALLLLYDSDSPLFYLLTDPTILALREEAARQRAAGVGGDGAAVDAPTLALHNVATAVAFGCAVLASDVLMRRRAQGVLKKIELGATGARLAAECASLHAHALARNITDHLDDLTFSSTGTAVRWYLQAGTAAKNKIYKVCAGARCSNACHGLQYAKLLDAADPHRGVRVGIKLRPYRH